MWKIKALAGGKDYLMRAHFGLPSVKTGQSLASLGSPGVAQSDLLVPSLSFLQTRPLSVYPSLSSSRSRTSPCRGFRSDTSRSWRRVDTRRCLGFGLVTVPTLDRRSLLRPQCSSDLSLMRPQYITQHGDDYSLRTVRHAPPILPHLTRR